jgi:hypothetical protein
LYKPRRKEITMAIHHGSCHCGAVQFDADLELTGLATCNCTICGKTGAIMAFLPADKLSGVTGEDKMTDYQFGKKSIHHAFCSVCGVRPFARGEGHDGAAWSMINVRCLDGVDAHTVTVEKQYNGKAL